MATGIIIIDPRGRSAVLAIVALAAGCERASHDAPACPPLAVVLDGKPLPAPRYGLAWSGSDGAIAVEMFDHDGVTCDELYARIAHGRTMLAGELGVGAWSGDKPPMATAVSFGINAELHVERSVSGPDVVVDVIARPGRAGDRAALCVRRPVTIQLGEAEGGALPEHPAVEIVGTLAGRYCPPPR